MAVKLWTRIPKLPMQWRRPISSKPRKSTRKFCEAGIHVLIRRWEYSYWRVRNYGEKKYWDIYTTFYFWCCVALWCSLLLLARKNSLLFDSPMSLSQTIKLKKAIYCTGTFFVWHLFAFLITTALLFLWTLSNLLAILMLLKTTSSQQIG